MSKKGKALTNKDKKTVWKAQRVRDRLVSFLLPDLFKQGEETLVLIFSNSYKNAKKNRGLTRREIESVKEFWKPMRELIDRVLHRKIKLYCKLNYKLLETEPDFAKYDQRVKALLIED